MPSLEQDLTLRLQAQDVNLTSTFFSANEAIEKLGDSAARSQAVLSAFRGVSGIMDTLIGSAKQLRTDVAGISAEELRASFGRAADEADVLNNTLQVIQQLGTDLGFDDLLGANITNEVVQLQDFRAALERVRDNFPEGSAAANLFTNAINAIGLRLVDAQGKMESYTAATEQASRAQLVLQNANIDTSQSVAKQAAEFEELANAALTAQDPVAIENLRKQWEAFVASQGRAANASQQVRNAISQADAAVRNAISGTAQYRQSQNELSDAVISRTAAEAEAARLGVTTTQATQERIAAIEQAIIALEGDNLATQGLIAVKQQLQQVLANSAKAHQVNAVAANAGRFAFQNFSFAVQDAAQFGLGFNAGMRAIANNLDSVIFALIQTNAALKAANQSWAALIRTVLLGPVGILLAVNAITSLIQILPQLSAKLGAAEDSAKKFLEAVGELVSLQREYNKVTIATTDGAESLAEGLREATGEIRNQALALSQQLNPLAENVRALRSYNAINFGVKQVLAESLIAVESWTKGLFNSRSAQEDSLLALEDLDEGLREEAKQLFAQAKLWELLDKAIVEVNDSMTDQARIRQRVIGDATKDFSSLKDAQLDLAASSGRVAGSLGDIATELKKTAGRQLTIGLPIDNIEQFLARVAQATGLTANQIAQSLGAATDAVRERVDAQIRINALQIEDIRNLITGNEVLETREAKLSENAAIEARRRAELRKIRLEEIVVQEELTRLQGVNNDLTEREIQLSDRRVVLGRQAAEDREREVSAAEELALLQLALQQTDAGQRDRLLAREREVEIAANILEIAERQRLVLDESLRLRQGLSEIGLEQVGITEKLKRLQDPILSAERAILNERQALLAVEEELARLRETTLEELRISLDGEIDILEERTRLQREQNRLLEQGGRLTRLTLATLSDQQANQRERNLLLQEEIRLLARRNAEAQAGAAEQTRSRILTRARDILARQNVGGVDLPGLIRDTTQQQLTVQNEQLGVAAEHKEISRTHLQAGLAQFNIAAEHKNIGQSQLEVQQELLGVSENLAGFIEGLDLAALINQINDPIRSATGGQSAPQGPGGDETPPGQRGAPEGGFTPDTNAVRIIGQAAAETFGVKIEGQFRDPLTNLVNNGSASSQHLEAMALDMTGMRADIQALVELLSTLPGIRQDQVFTHDAGSGEHLHVGFEAGVAQHLEAIAKELPAIRNFLQTPPAHFEDEFVIPDDPSGVARRAQDAEPQRLSPRPVGGDTVNRNVDRARAAFQDFTGEAQRTRDALNVAFDEVLGIERLSNFGARWRLEMGSIRESWKAALGKEFIGGLELVVRELFTTAENLNLLAETSGTALSAIGQHFISTAQDGEKADLKRFEKGKKIAIAGAIISTAAGVMQAYRNHDPITASILAAGVIATGALQVAKIRATKPGSSSGGVSDSFSASPNVFAELPQGAVLGGSSSQPAFIFSGQGSTGTAPPSSLSIEAPALPETPQTPVIPQQAQAVHLSINPLEINVRLEGESRVEGRTLVQAINREVKAQRLLGVTQPI